MNQKDFKNTVTVKKVTSFLRFLVWIWKFRMFRFSPAFIIFFSMPWIFSLLLVYYFDDYPTHVGGSIWKLNMSITLLL